MATTSSLAPRRIKRKAGYTHFVSGGSRWFAFSYHPRDTLLTVFGQSNLGPVAGVDLRSYGEWTPRQKASVTDYLEDKSHDKVEVIRVA
jgi:hypothetical protein